MSYFIIYFLFFVRRSSNILVVRNYVKQQQQQWGTLYLVLYQVISCKLTKCTESVTFLSARAAGWPGDFWFWHLGWHTRQLVHQEESQLLPRACPSPTTCCRAVLTLSGFESQAICIHNKDSLWINVFAVREPVQILTDSQILECLVCQDVSRWIQVHTFTVWNCVYANCVFYGVFANTSSSLVVSRTSKGRRSRFN